MRCQKGGPDILMSTKESARLDGSKESGHQVGVKIEKC